MTPDRRLRYAQHSSNRSASVSGIFEILHRSSDLFSMCDSRVGSFFRGWLHWHVEQRHLRKIGMSGRDNVSSRFLFLRCIYECQERHWVQLKGFAELIK